MLKNLNHHLNREIPLPRLSRRRTKKSGTAPGTLMHIGERKTEEVSISVIAYDGETLLEKTGLTLPDCREWKKDWVDQNHGVLWFNMDGLHDVDAVQGLGNIFGLHPLMLEDILNTDQRPKTDEYTEQLLIVLKMLHVNGKGAHRLETEQVSMVLGRGYVLTFQEKAEDVLNPLRERIRRSDSRIRSQPADYLFYSMLDTFVDSYFPILDRYGNRIEEMETEVLGRPGPHIVTRINRLRREVMQVRKSLVPLRDLLLSLERTEVRFLSDHTLLYLRDVFDHAVLIVEDLNSYRDILNHMVELYLSNTSNRMNEQVKVLTALASIFIPLTFIAGVYGMNFRYMPELEWRYGYFAVLGVMLVTAASLWAFFKRKKLL